MATQKREPVWAAAARALAEGRLKPLPRIPSVRPEADYEMDLSEVALPVPGDPAPSPVSQTGKEER